MGKDKNKIRFGDMYSDVYDEIYKDKDYERECDFLEEIFREFNIQPRTILDLGCGSGGHAIPLALRGYKVTGVDISPYMLRKAEEKTKKLLLNITLKKGDIRKIKLREKFDAVISMFAVMSYQVGNNDVLSALKTAYLHLKKGGLFIFDVWFGPSVLTQKPYERIKEIEKEKEKIIRIAKPKVDIINHTVEVNYRVLKIKKGEKNEITEFEEKHKVRYFFPKEIEFMGKIAGFEEIHIFPFLDMRRAPTTEDWNITVVAKKK